MRGDGRVLVIDDEDRVREVFAQFLEARGYSVVTAATGPDALTAVTHYHPDVVLLDIMMPRMKGLDALERIRQLDPRVGIIMLTDGR